MPWMVKKRWFRFYIDRWRNGTFGLKPNEITAYITVLCELYDNDGFAELDAKVLAMRCGMRPSSFQKAIDGLISKKKLGLKGGYLTSKPVSEEIIDREKLAQKSEETRAKLAQKYPKNPMKTIEGDKKNPHIQNKEYRKENPTGVSTEKKSGIESSYLIDILDRKIPGKS